MGESLSMGLLSIVTTALVNACGTSPTIVMLARGDKLICGCIMDGTDYLPFSVDVQKRHAAVYHDQVERTLRYGTANALSIEEYIKDGTIQDPHKGV